MIMMLMIMMIMMLMIVIQRIRRGRGQRAHEPQLYWQHIDEFKSIFDAAGIGQYIGGTDPRNRDTDSVGFVNEASVFVVSRAKYEWIRDEKGRFILYAYFRNEKIKINNLHCHSKRLYEFYSLNPNVSVPNITQPVRPI